MALSPKSIPAAEFLADMLMGRAETRSTMATVQRSHRFPLHIHCIIENMAQMANAPVSLIINQILEAGIDSVLKELDPEVAASLRLMTEAQLQQPTESVSVESNRLKSRGK